MNSPRAVLLAPLLAVLAACGASETPSSSTVETTAPAASATEAAPEPAAVEPEVAQALESGKSWALVEATDDTLRAAAVEAGIFIEVQDGRIVGYGGCNRFSVPLERGADSSISLGAVVASKRACGSDVLNAAEQTFLQTLGAAQSFELRDQALYLRSAGGAELKFSAGRPSGADGEASQAEGT